MSVKNLGMVIVAHHPYIRNLIAEGQLPSPENDILFSAISQTYIPLIDLLHKIENENIAAKFSIVLSPTVCAMLDDEYLQTQYINWLDRQIELGKAEIARLENFPDLKKNAEEILAKAIHNKDVFVEVYNCNLVKEFKYFYKKGLIEIIATTATQIFMPHYNDMPEILSAQVELGIISHKKYFDDAPEGFYLPFMGYSKGLESVIRSYGITYTILESSSILFNDEVPESGIFKPVRCFNTLVVFARDSKANLEISNEDDGFVTCEVYKNQEKDIGFELSAEELKSFYPVECARSNTLYRYWNKDDEIYDSEAAFEQVKSDAIEFLKNKNEKLEKASQVLEGNVNLICVIDAEMLGQKWAEGLDFFEQVMLNNCESNFALPSELIENKFQLQRVQLYPSAASGTGYGEDLLDNSNSWMLFYTRKMCERMVDLANRFPSESGLKDRLLNLGAKEVMLALNGELAKFMHEEFMSDFAKNNFTSSILTFTKVFDALGTNEVSTEWLTRVEKNHTLFPWINYKIFAKKQ